jgi:hypothetical protein
VDSFNKTFEKFITSTYSVPDYNDIQKGIEWYNNNIILIGLNNLCPIKPIDKIDIHAYMFVYASGMLACGNIKDKLSNFEKI